MRQVSRLLQAGRKYVSSKDCKIVSMFLTFCMTFVDLFDDVKSYAILLICNKIEN